METTDNSPAPAGLAEGVTDPIPPQGRGINTGGLSLRAFAARGVLLNSGFDLGISALGLLRSLILAALLSRADFGVWGILIVSVGVLAQLKLVGVSDRYVQQDEPDQELAFQRAFTVELIATAFAGGTIVVALPAVALIYGHWSLIPPGLALVSILVAGALQAPIWIHYREMNFLRQRSLTAIEPVVGFVVAVALAVAGAGYWALVIGVVAGAWTTTLAAITSSPYKLRWRFDRSALRVYAAYSGPLFVATIGGVVLANGAAIASNAHLGLAGVGAVTLSATITAFTARLDSLISGTLYPAICAIQNRLDLLRESFVKSNRLALMWAMPFGCVLTLFASDLVHYILGEKWRPAVVLLQITGVVAAVGHIAFNWDDYFRARGDTAPIAVASVAATVTFLAVGIPLLFLDGLTGLAIGIAAQAAVHLACRAWYLSRLFEGFAFARHALRAMLPSLPAILIVLLARQLERGPRTAVMAASELAAYVVAIAVGTWRVEGELLREVIGYLARRRDQPGGAAVAIVTDAAQG